MCARGTCQCNDVNPFNHDRSNLLSLLAYVEIFFSYEFLNLQTAAISVFVASSVEHGVFR